MASGRRPSIDRITTRDARTVGVGVKVGNGVSVGDGVNVAVSVGVTLGVKVSVAVGALRAGTLMSDNWHPRNTNKERIDNSALRVL
jgi:predicted thioesterase